MKTKILILLLLIVRVSYSQENNNSYKDYMKTVTFNIGGGVLIPQDGLKEYFGVSPLLELSAKFPLKNKKSLVVAMQFVIPTQKEEFVYIRTIDTVSAKATFMFNPMVKFKKSILNSDVHNLNLGLGIGASIIHTNARNPFYDGNNEKSKKYEMITSILVSPELEYVRKFSNNDELSIVFGVQYSPYKIEGALREDIGSIFFVPKITYKF